MLARKILALRGMHDILPPQTHCWSQLEARSRGLFSLYGYEEIRTPICEETSLFARSLGEATDIVQKEMYSFTDPLGGEHITLRPEGTAGCVRAANEHHLLRDGPKRYFYIGPMFRHERPQKGRFRQFHQIGAEALGFSEIEAEAEGIFFLARLWKSLEIGERLGLQINTLGKKPERQRYREILQRHFLAHEDLLDEEDRTRLTLNPLRLLDSKKPELAPVIAAAPSILEALDEASLVRFDSLLSLLREEGISFEVNPRLVRGLDYYNDTVFEWVSPELGAQSTVAAGGRYDALMAQLGGENTPACGFAIGMERLLLLLEDVVFPSFAPDVAMVHLGEAARRFAFFAAERLRDAGIRVAMGYAQASMKAQMRRADACGASFAAIIGEEEERQRMVTLKSLAGDKTQVLLSLDEAITRIKGHA